MKGGTSMSESAERGRGRVFRPPGRKVWMLAYYGPKGDGRRGEIRESAKTRDEAVAWRKLERKRREVANDQDGIADFEAPAQKRLTVAGLFDDLLQFYERQEVKSLDDARYRVREGSPLRNFFGRMRACDVTTATVDRYINLRRTEGRKNATINREVELLRRAFRVARTAKKLVRVPEMPEKLPEKNARQGFFEKAELDRLLPHLPQPLDDMTRFAFKSGWRRGELRTLTWESVVGNEIRLGWTKNGQPRSLPLDGQLAELIERRRRAREYRTASGVGLSAYVFHRNGKPINKTVFGKQWRAACILAGLGRYVADEKGKRRYSGKIFHDLRRTAARNMIRAGVPQAVAMTVTGHETDSMFTRYNITDERDKLEALEKARGYVEGQRAEVSNVVNFGSDGRP
jgi:integrase